MKSGDRPVSCVWITHVHLSARADAVGPCPAMPLHRCVQARAVRGLGTPCPCSRLALAHARPPSPPAAQTRLRPSADGGTSGRGAAGGSQYATFARAVNPNNRPPTLSAVAPSGSPRWRPQLGPWYGPADPLGYRRGSLASAQGPSVATTSPPLPPATVIGHGGPLGTRAGGCSCEAESAPARSALSASIETEGAELERGECLDPSMVVLGHRILGHLHQLMRRPVDERPQCEQPEVR